MADEYFSMILPESVKKDLVTVAEMLDYDNCFVDMYESRTVFHHRHMENISITITGETAHFMFERFGFIPCMDDHRRLGLCDICTELGLSR